MYLLTKSHIYCNIYTLPSGSTGNYNICVCIKFLITDISTLAQPLKVAQAITFQLYIFGDVDAFSKQCNENTILVIFQLTVQLFHVFFLIINHITHFV